MKKAGGGSSGSEKKGERVTKKGDGKEKRKDERLGSSTSHLEPFQDSSPELLLSFNPPGGAL